MTPTEIQLKINKISEKHIVLKDEIKKLLDIIDMSYDEANAKLAELDESEKEYVKLIEELNNSTNAS